MSNLDSVLARVRGERPTKAAPAAVPAWLRAGATDEAWRIPDMTQTERQAGLYQQLSWLQSAVGILARTAAAATYSVSRRQGERTTPIVSHPFELLLQQPNPLQSRFELLEATFAWRKIAGNCYWFLNRPSETAPPDEIWIIPAHQIRPVPNGQSFLRGYLYDAGDGRPITLEPWEVAHFKTFNPLSKYVGLSAVQAVALAGLGDIAAQRYKLNFFAQDNAKQAGIIAFAEAIDQDRWDRLRKEAEERYGGTKNKRVMWMRGVGAGGVQWIPTALTDNDMQFLEQRRFTKEEIYDLVAPGLSSILSVNATEANSTAGKDTFLSLAVYPEHVAVAEKITNDLLPSYGAALVGAFEDVRRVDTMVELAEQEAYAKSHTIDEVREKYYGDGPLPPDARTLAQGPQPPAPQPAQPDALPAEAIVQAGKALDRRRWRDKAAKAFIGGRPLDVAFDPDFLTDDEAMQIRAALKHARTAEDVAGAFAP